MSTGLRTPYRKGKMASGMELVPIDGNTPTMNTLQPAKVGGHKVIPTIPVSMFLTYVYEQLEISVITVALVYHVNKNFNCFEPKVLIVTFFAWLLSFIIFRWIMDAFNNMRSNSSGK